MDDFRKILREGADKVAVNSAAIMNPNLIADAADKFGSQCVVLAIDAKRNASSTSQNFCHERNTAYIKAACKTCRY